MQTTRRKSASCRHESAAYVCIVGCECCYRALQKQRLRQNNSLWRIHGTVMVGPIVYILTPLKGPRLEGCTRDLDTMWEGLGNFPSFAVAFHNRRKCAVTIFFREFLFFIIIFPEVLWKTRASLAMRHCVCSIEYN